MITKILKPVSIYIIILFFLIYYYYSEIQTFLIYLGYITISLFVVLFVFTIFFGGWWISEKIKMIRASRIEAEKNAHVLVIQESGQIFIRDTDHSATWRAAHLQQSLYTNGHYERPSLEEQRAWEKFIATKSLPAKSASNNNLLLEGEVVQQPTNLMDELNNEHRVLLVGASNSGKTNLLKHIVNNRLSTSQVIVIDPHSHPDKWPGCEVVGIGRDYGQIEYTLDELVNLMTQRYEEIGKGKVSEEGHDRITVIIDEWRAIAQHTDNATNAISTLLTESRKAAFSVFVACHSERVKALGIEGEGDLKDGFVMVRLSWENGKRIATIDRGNGQMRTTLPGEFIRFNQTNKLSEKVFSIPNGPKPDETEAKILELYDEGENVSNIAKSVYGHKSGNYNAKVKDTLSKFDYI